MAAFATKLWAGVSRPEGPGWPREKSEIQAFTERERQVPAGGGSRTGVIQLNFREHHEVAARRLG